MDQQSPSGGAELRAELERLSEKSSSVQDPDIRAALAARIEQIKGELDAIAPADSDVAESVPDPPRALSSTEESELRSELAKVSAQRYITEDPATRVQLQARVAELQRILGIDVAKLAGSELSQSPVTELNVPKTKSEPKKGKTDLADLQALVAEKSALIRKTENATEIDLPANPEPPTPEQADAAEKLVQQARVEKMRGNKQEVRRLLEQAVQTAPGSPTVLEILGDDYAERKQIGKALAYYRRASALDPKNVNLERKVAMSALGIDSAGSLDQQMQANLGLGMDESAIPMASRRAAMLLSLFLPGLGHIVLGRKTKGWTILAIWCAMLAWSILMGGDIAKLGSLIVGGKSQPNMIVIVPLFVMVVLYFATLADFKGAKETVRKPVEHPRPPVNLPFE